MLAEDGASRGAFRAGRHGNHIPVAPVVLVIVATVALAVLLAALLPGAGLIGAIVVVVLGLAIVVWLVSAGASRQAPSDVVRETEQHEFLGPGGPDDPRRD